MPYDSLNNSAPKNRAGRAGPVERLAAAWLFKTLRRLRRGRLTVSAPGGAQTTAQGLDSAEGPHGVIHIRSPRLLWRLLSAGEIGLAESWMAGEFSTPDLTSLLKVLQDNASALSEGMHRLPFHQAFERLRHRRRANTKRGSRRNIAAHYDLGNEFFSRWLDPGMTYSAALFEKPDFSLQEAQTAKYAALCRELDIKPGDKLLEIGCGWGGFAEYAASQRGAQVTALTISEQQFEYAKNRIRRAGLEDRVEIRLQDYRDTDGKFDCVASIEMFEAVGADYWPVFFKCVKERLKPGGAAAMQVITIEEDYFEIYCAEPDFIRRYIFPGGMLPSPERFAQAAAEAGLLTQSARSFGRNYAETLRRWRESFEDAWHDIGPMGFDERFRRMWTYYLSCCESGFDIGRTDVRHFTLRSL